MNLVSIPDLCFVLCYKSESQYLPVLLQRSENLCCTCVCFHNTWILRHLWLLALLPPHPPPPLFFTSTLHPQLRKYRLVILFYFKLRIALL